jgi:large subunit ribosomal protein L4
MSAETVTVTIDLETATPAEIRRFLRPAPRVRTVSRRSSEGTELGEVDLDPSIFGIEPNLDVLHQVVTAQLAAARSGTQSTKTRAEVRGGGAKPFRQKGTGRARQGSTRSPQWIGGGVALGPKPRSYAQKTPKKMIQLALRSALSDRAAQGRVALVDAWPFEVPRTKDAVASLRALGLSGRVLVVLGAEDGYADRSFGNLPEVQTIVSGELNAYDILVNDWIVFTDETLPGGAGDQVDDVPAAEAATPEPAAVASAATATEPAPAAGQVADDTASGSDADDTASGSDADDTASGSDADDTEAEPEGSGS